jgi:hypothetical protein
MINQTVFPLKNNRLFERQYRRQVLFVLLVQEYLTRMGSAFFTIKKRFRPKELLNLPEVGDKIGN